MKEIICGPVISFHRKSTSMSVINATLNSMVRRSNILIRNAAHANKRKLDSVFESVATA